MLCIKFNHFLLKKKKKQKKLVIIKGIQFYQYFVMILISDKSITNMIFGINIKNLERNFSINKNKNNNDV